MASARQVRQVRQDAEQLDRLMAELAGYLNEHGGTCLREDDPRARAALSARLAGMDGGPKATENELRELVRGVAASWAPHMITIQALVGPKYSEHLARARAALKNPERTQAAPQTPGGRRAAARRRRRSKP